MKAASRIPASTGLLVSTFSRFQMPRRGCISVWQGYREVGLLCLVVFGEYVVASIIHDSRYLRLTARRGRLRFLAVFLFGAA